MTGFDSRTRDKAAEVAEDAQEGPRALLDLARKAGDTTSAIVHATEILTAKEIAAAIRALPAASQGGWMVPEGYKLVPVDPTEEMLSAVWGSKEINWRRLIEQADDADVGAIYRAMLEAAPPPPSQDGDAG